ncbi:inactive serine protease 54-like [Paramacrobiotus metropolitanus]|uniref:inactive serine protease 54-like n=1 Tax=Paramacrobiotus metropolitanus TaxID=2943436 RepID=UPI0024457183|nr:inactive serine protease 54-like [Paramacrobiotus metropolitanus]
MPSSPLIINIGCTDTRTSEQSVDACGLFRRRSTGMDYKMITLALIASQLFFCLGTHAQQARLISSCKSSLGRGRCTSSESACDALGGVTSDQESFPTLPRPRAFCERGEVCCVLLPLPLDDHCMTCGQPGSDPVGAVTAAGSLAADEDMPRRILPNFEAVSWGLWRPRQFQPEMDAFRYKRGVGPLDGEEALPVSRISALNRWCWQVALTDRNGTIFASGVLVDGQNVVTLARNVYRRQPEDVTVVLGAWDFVRPLDSPNQAVWFTNPKQIVVHDQFDPMTFANDLAVLRIPLAPCEQRNICPVCITDLPVDANRMGMPESSGKEHCYITGWGAPNNAGFTNALRETPVKLTDRAQCTRALADMGVVGFTIPDSHFCATVTQPRPTDTSQSVCESDAGAPLVCQSMGDKKWYLRGLVSLTTEPCALEGRRPFLSTDVGMFYPWIRVQTNALDARFTNFPAIPNRHLIRSNAGLTPRADQFRPIAVPRSFDTPAFLRFL